MKDATGVIFFSTFFILISYNHITIAINSIVSRMMMISDKFFLGITYLEIPIANKLAPGIQGKQVLIVTNGGEGSDKK